MGLPQIWQTLFGTGNKLVKEIIPFGTEAGEVMAGDDSRVTKAVPNTRKVLTEAGLSGGGVLTADIKLALDMGYDPTKDYRKPCAILGADGQLYAWRQASGPGVAGVGVKEPGKAGSEGVWGLTTEGCMLPDFSNATGKAPDTAKWEGAHIQFGPQAKTPDYVIGWDGTYPATFLPFSKNKFISAGVLSLPHPSSYAQVDITGDSSSSTLVLRSFSNYGAEMMLYVNSAGFRSFQPSTSNDGQILFGQGNARLGQVHSTSSTIATSDLREKTAIEDIPEDVLQAWGKVNFCQFKMRDAVEKKGPDGARIHTGVIAQHVKEVFESEGLDGFRYGLLCYDEWDDKAAVTEVEVVEISPAQYDDEGNLIKGATTETRMKEVMPAVVAGNRYAMRYEEALAMEAAWSRWRADKAEARLTEIEDRLATLEARP